MSKNSKKKTKNSESEWNTQNHPFLWSFLHFKCTLRFSRNLFVYVILQQFFSCKKISYLYFFSFSLSFALFSCPHFNRKKNTKKSKERKRQGDWKKKQSTLQFNLTKFFTVVFFLFSSIVPFFMVVVWPKAHIIQIERRIQMRWNSGSSLRFPSSSSLRLFRFFSRCLHLMCISFFCHCLAGFDYCCHRCGRWWCYLFAVLLIPYEFFHNFDCCCSKTMKWNQKRKASAKI